MKRKIENFSKALKKLEEAVNQAKTDIEIDGVIKRFEFTFELSWKAIKDVLYESGIMCVSPKGCLKEAYAAGLIQEDEIWLSMLTDRNLSVHIYDERTSREIFKRIREIYMQELRDFEKRIKENVI